MAATIDSFYSKAISIVPGIGLVPSTVANYTLVKAAKKEISQQPGKFCDKRLKKLVSLGKQYALIDTTRNLLTCTAVATATAIRLLPISLGAIVATLLAARAAYYYWQSRRPALVKKIL